MTESFRPWTWKIPEGGAGGKRGLIRQDGYARVSGQASYTKDICLPGMLHAKILISPYAHAKILNLDASEAEALAGVRDILKYCDPDIAEDNVRGIEPAAASYSILTLPGISDFYQHPMGVVVVADSEEVCDRALKLIKIEWEERPFILDMEESLKADAPKIMPEVKRLNRMAKEPNTASAEEVEIGDVKKGFAEADKVIEYTIKKAWNSPAGVEALSCVAQWQGDFLNLWVHHQVNPQGNLSGSSRRSLGTSGISSGRAAQPFTDWSKITVTFPYQGSLFGGLAWLSYSTAFIRLATLLAKRAAGKPVKLVFDESNFYCNGDDAGTYACKVGVKKDGTITAAQWDIVGVRNPIFDKTYECTAIPNLRGTNAWPFVNKGHQMCYRHGAHAAVPHGVMMDRVAAELGLDPTEVALKNDGCQGHNWAWVTQYQKDNGFPQRWSLKEVIDAGKKAIGWDRKWHAPGANRLANGRMHGLGFISINEWNWHPQSRSFPCLVLRDGTVNILGLHCDCGINVESGFRQCVASELGMKYEDILVQVQHSDVSTFDLAPPGGSWGTTSAVAELVIAARELKQKILGYAVHPGRGSDIRLTEQMLKQAQREIPAQLLEKLLAGFFPNKKPGELDIKDSEIYEIANPANKMPVKQVTNAFWARDPAIIHPVAGEISGLAADGKPDPTMYVMGRQAHFIEVEVDTDTGQVEVTNVVCVNDVGNIFNPEGAEGQQYGGAVMGLGRSIMEEKVFCPRSGVALNNNHIGYPIGTMNDYPPAECILNESHLGYSAYGAYGIGENVGAAMSGLSSAAIYNAIGKWVLDYPTSPDKVLKALGKI
jgi:CO/xanthine dehydrogenase Mo-binding subunit